MWMTTPPLTNKFHDLLQTVASSDQKLHLSTEENRYEATPDILDPVAFPLLVDSPVLLPAKGENMSPIMAAVVKRKMQ